MRLGQAGIQLDRPTQHRLRLLQPIQLQQRAAKIAKGSGEPNREKVGTVTTRQVKEIAEMKAPDLNSNDIEMAMRIVAGTARSMGIDVVEG